MSRFRFRRHGYIIKLDYYFTAWVFRVGAALKEWACIHAGGTHDYVEGRDDCIVCGRTEA